MLTMQVISVDKYNAFGVNTVGLQGAPFPLSISVVEAEHLWAIHATAARACDLVDVLATNAHSSAAVLNLGHTSWLDDDYTPWPPSRIAREQNIAFTSHDIRWAASARFRSDDLLVMSWQHLHRFLDGWSHHDIEIIDLPAPLEDPEADELALVINTHDDAACLLPQLPGSRIYYSGHDDCYVYAETTDSSLPTRLFARLLGLFAGSALLDDHTDTVTVPEPAESLVKALLRQSSHWVGTVLSAQPSRAVTLGLVPSHKSWRMPDPIPRQAPHTITLDLEASAWKLLLPGDPSQALDLST